MLRYIQKAETWAEMEAGTHSELGWRNGDIHLKTWQDVAVWRHVGQATGQRIAEIGGGHSRILRRLSEANDCVNVDRLAGEHGGPSDEQDLPQVRTVRTFLGEFSPELEDGAFDYVISVSVIEHVPHDRTDAFFDDMLRILKPGGRSIHAIDLYVGDEPIPASQGRLEIYADWLSRREVAPLGPIEATRSVFSSSMASNPDLTMYHWNRSAPRFRDLRERTQSVSLLLGFDKRG